MLDANSKSSAIIEALEEWKGIARECERELLYNVHSPDKPPYIPPWNKFSDITEEIAVWCDSGQCFVDPSPLIRFEKILREYLRGSGRCFIRENGDVVEETREERDLVIVSASNDSHAAFKRIWNVAIGRQFQAKIATEEADASNGQLSIQGSKNREPCESVSDAIVRMVDNDRRLIALSISQWADYFGCSRSTVGESKGWDYVKKLREAERKEAEAKYKGG